MKNHPPYYHLVFRWPAYLWLIEHFASFKVDCLPLLPEVFDFLFLLVDIDFDPLQEGIGRLERFGVQERLKSALWDTMASSVVGMLLLVRWLCLLLLLRLIEKLVEDVVMVFGLFHETR